MRPTKAIVNPPSHLDIITAAAMLQGRLRITPHLPNLLCQRLLSQQVRMTILFKRMFADCIHLEVQRPQAVQRPLSSSEGRKHSFQCSRCTGQRKALCVSNTYVLHFTRSANHCYLKIGINYKGQQNELLGCVNDAKNVQRFLRSA